MVRGRGTWGKMMLNIVGKGEGDMGEDDAQH